MNAAPRTAWRLRLAAAVMEARTSRGLTFRAAGETTGIDPSHLAKIETGKITPSIAVLLRIAEGYGITLRDILDSARLL